MTRQTLLTAGTTAWVVTSYITFCLVAVNVGFKPDFVWLWLRSWLIAWGLAFPSLLFVGPFFKRKLTN